MHTNLTSRIKEHAFALGADLVGIAPIDRFSNAPLLMSPQGILPGGKYVVVCALHHPDGAVQKGGERGPTKQDSYCIQFAMNDMLDRISFAMGKYIDSLGYQAVAIAASNIWRFNRFRDLQERFAPDMSHIYSAVAAGLSELGWNGLSISPEYGAWNRFVSIITDAELEETPLYNDKKLCDMCGNCVRRCPTDAYRQECEGARLLKVGDKTYRFANKNLWRCSWCECFGQALDKPLPETITEETVHDSVEKNGHQAGEIGNCLKYCLPAHLRGEIPAWSSTYRRLRPMAPEGPAHRALYDKAVGIARKYVCDSIAFLNEAQLVQCPGWDKALPVARGAIVYRLRVRRNTADIAARLAHHGYGKGGQVEGLDLVRTAMDSFHQFANYELTRLFEDAGYDSLCLPDYVPNTAKPPVYALAGGLGEEDPDDLTYTGAVLVSAPLKARVVTGLQIPDRNPRLSAAENLRRFLVEAGADLYAAAGASRFDALSDEVRRIRGGDEMFQSYDTHSYYQSYIPNVSTVHRVVSKPADYVKNAKSVLMLGIGFPTVVTARAIQPPAYAPGPYVFAQYQVLRELSFLALRVCTYLEGLGYQAAMTPDLTGNGGDVMTVRGMGPDAVANSLEAVEAGIGSLALNGQCVTNEYGLNQRFVAIVTDFDAGEWTSVQPFETDVNALCQGCHQCVKSCPAKALNEDKAVAIRLSGKAYTWIPADAKRCDWARKFGLMGEEGPLYTSINLNVEPPYADMDDEKARLLDALAQTDPFMKNQITITERCIVDCPLANGQYTPKED